MSKFGQLMKYPTNGDEYDLTIHMVPRKFRTIVPFSRQFVAEVGEDRLSEFVSTPDGHKPSEITFAKKLSETEVELMFLPHEVTPKNCDFWMFEGFA